MGIKRFEEINAWQEAKKLTNIVYEVTKHQNFAKDFGLRDQIRRAAISVMSNIAEGYESQSKNDFVKFLYYAKRSAGEVRSQLYVALDQKYLSAKENESLFGQAELCVKMISKFISYLEKVNKLQG
jgi:four helix bundle protein